ncbi:MAG: FAD-binding oxidoreductase [Wenzhouxiangella sp.]|jgi:FAD/FMN-containing dehydrogenase|nr:FAD-binding oxidoreductase [Wenzhouxiangella sp.]
MTDFLSELGAVLDPSGLLLPGDDLHRFEREWRGRFTSRPIAVARPLDSGMLARVVQCCRKHSVAMVPQGGNTGLVGGAVACGERRELIVSLERMRRVRELNVESACMTVEAGCSLGEASRLAEQEGFRLPLALSSGDSATIGGVLATNAGGNETIRFGNARQMVLGLEAVMGDGSIWRGLSSLRKDNRGYNLAQLLVGSEGTLGIITAASLSLKPLPKQREAAWLAVPSPAAALAVLKLLRRSMGETVTAFELISAQAIEFVATYRPDLRCPIDPKAPWHLLVECDATTPGQWLRDAMLDALAEADESIGSVDGVVAESGAQRELFWEIRESISDAQKTGGVSLKHDISLPIDQIPAFIDHCLNALGQRVPGIRPCVFGHLGDGNLHFNLSQPVHLLAEQFKELEPEINTLVFERVMAVGGSIAAEHGIGLLRKEWLEKSLDQTALQTMKRIKQALDPLHLMNPGKVF